jgi:nifR3 family TIM-barrel protein
MDFRSFLAPIDGYTNLPFRLLCQRHGAEACCVPLVSAYTIARERKKMSMADTHADEKNVGVQLVGKDPAVLGIAAKELRQGRPISWLNLNCGCPSAHTRGSGGGSALLSQPDIIVRAVEAMKEASSVPVSVKLRIAGGPEETMALCRRIEAAGADFIIVHGRTPEQGYSGNCDWELIKKIKERSHVPVVGNGDLKSASEGRARVEGGYCDAFMIGRAAMANPLCFSDGKPDGLGGRFSLLDEYIALSRRYLGNVALQDLKLKAMNLLSCVPGACASRDSIAKAKSVGEIMALRETR